MRKHYYYNDALDMGYLISKVSQTKDTITLKEVLYNQGKPWVMSVCTMKYTSWRIQKKKLTPTHKWKKPILKAEFIPFDTFEEIKE